MPGVPPGGVCGLRGVPDVSASDSCLAELVPAVEGCDGVEQLVERAGSVLARQLALRELWWIDPEQGVLHARAGGVLPLNERRLSELDAGSAALVRRACAATSVCVLDGETESEAGESVKLALLALPLRRSERLLGVLGLVCVQAASFSPALLHDLASLSAPLAGAMERFRWRDEERRLQAALRRAESRSQLGRLAAAMAHEIRNPLAAMAHAVGILRVNPGLGPDDHTLVEILLEELERVDRIATDFLDFAKPSSGRFRRLPIEDVVDGALALLRRDPRLGPGTELATALAPGLPPLRLDPDKIRQVLWNLCLNAAQALPRGGRISVRAHALREGAREGVCIEVCDDGPGIARELRERVFQPFETTRPNGTGLGLALARHSVELHQGWIRIDEAPGGGACVRFWLPVAGPSALPEERHQALVPEERHEAALSEARGEE